MNILFIGCVESSFVFLDALIKDSANIVGVITKEHSDFNADFVDLAPLCKKNSIPYIYVKNINDQNSKEFIINKNADVGYCLGWSQLVSGEIIDLFPLGMVGYHPAALPNNRGRHPIIWALALGLENTASTFFKIDKAADMGDILSQTQIDISYEDNANTLMQKLVGEGAKQIVALTKDYEIGNVNAIPQVQSEGNSWRKRGRADGQIDWRMSSRSIYNLVRALSKPYIGAHIMVGNQEVKIWKVREWVNAEEFKNIEPGKIVNVKENSFTVKTGDNLIEVLDYDKFDITEGQYL